MFVLTHQGKIMAIEFVYNNQNNILTAKVKGCLDIDEFEVFMKNLVSATDIPSDVNALWDIREMEFDNIDFEFENRLVERVKQFANVRGTAKAAIVSNYTLGYPLIKMLVILLEEISRNVKAFEVVEEAEHWLMN